SKHYSTPRRPGGRRHRRGGPFRTGHRRLTDRASLVDEPLRRCRCPRLPAHTRRTERARSTQQTRLYRGFCGRVDTSAQLAATGGRFGSGRGPTVEQRRRRAAGRGVARRRDRTVAAGAGEITSARWTAAQRARRHTRWALAGQLGVRRSRVFAATVARVHRTCRRVLSRVGPELNAWRWSRFVA